MKTWTQSPAPHAVGVVADAWNVCVWEGREEDQEDHLVHPLLHGELEANLGYIRLCHKTKQLSEHLTEFRPTPFPSLFSQGELDWTVQVGQYQRVRYRAECQIWSHLSY